MAEVVVVDASLALKWVAHQPYSDEASQLLSQWGAIGVAIIAPALFII